MESKKSTLVFVIIIFLLIVGCIVFMQNRFTKNGKLMNAETLGWIYTSNVTLNLQYEFYYNGTKVVRSNAFNKFMGNNQFVHRFFSVMYDPDTKLSQLLIQPSDFKRFHLDFPDSLQWVLKYLK